MSISFVNALKRKFKNEDKSTVEALSKLQKIILNTLDFNEVVKISVNSVLDELGYLKLGYKIIVLALVDEHQGVLKRIAISQTQEAEKALKITPVPFKEIIIPLTNPDNFSVQAIKGNKVMITQDWYNLFLPVYTPDEAKMVQTSVGIKTSMIYPVFVKGKSIGTLIFSMTKKYEEVSEREKELLAGFTDLVGLAVQNSSLYTSLAQTSKQLQEANKKLQELDKLKDDFVSVASHELRTPMTAIRSYVWMALSRPDMPLSEKLKKYLSRTLISTERLINLVNDMLNISRIESGSIEILPQAFDIIGLVGDVFEEVKMKSEDKHLILNLIDTKLPPVFADPDKVHQVLLNLIGNAMKFISDNGYIKVSFFSDGRFVETSIQDNGAGISKDDLPRLFQKFGRLDNSYVATATSGGTGLGLYICKSLVTLMGGKIRAYSEGEGKGAIFTFSLPAASQENILKAQEFTRKAVGQPKDLEPAVV